MIQARHDDLAARLRVEVGRFREHERRRRFDPAIQVGRIGEAATSAVVPTHRLEYVDRQVRTELFSALLEVGPQDLDSAWVTRAGAPVLEPDDIAWMVGAESAFGAAGMTLGGCYVITRHGWVDVRTGTQRVWKRLRLKR